jgi:hypothetical protein
MHYAVHVMPNAFTASIVPYSTYQPTKFALHEKIVRKTMNDSQILAQVQSAESRNLIFHTLATLFRTR